MAEDAAAWLAEEEAGFFGLPSAAAHFNACDIRPHAALDAARADPAQARTLALVWWTNVVLLPAVALLGLACNALNLLVLTRNRAARRMPSWHLLVALSLCDALFLLCATLDLTPAALHVFMSSPLLNGLHTKLVLYVRTLASSFFRASILIVAAFNLERYVCVCKPLWAHRVCTARTSLAAILLSLLVAFACSLQWPLVYAVTECYDSVAGHAYYVITMREEAALQVYYELTNYLSLLMFNVLPVLLLLCLNVQLVRTLRRVVDQDRRRSSGADTTRMLAAPPSAAAGEPDGDVSGTEESAGRGRFNANAMLFAVVLLLLVCIGPQAPARFLYDHYGPYHPNVVVYMCISQLLVFLNASLNFCLYCLVSRRYRALLRETLARCTLRADSELCTWTSAQLKTKFSMLLLHSSQRPAMPAGLEQQQQLEEEEQRRLTLSPALLERRRASAPTPTTSTSTQV